MIRTNRFLVALLLTLGLAVASLGCDSSSDGESGPLRILITNDDGVGAAGIDAVVEALKDDPNNEIIVSAPATNQSGSGDSTTVTPPPLEAMMTETASGYPATAVMGFPADSVIYALANLYPGEPPHVVLSGLNDGQNVGDWNGGLLSQISGTVGAAKTAACLGVPALASSQGEGDTVDFASGVVEVVTWLEANRGALLAGEVSLDNVTSINIPSCDTGSIRGREEVPLGTEKPADLSLNGPQDCESTLENPTDDIQAFFNGYVSVTLVPSNSSMTCDGLN
jgi:5'-nucleotidase